MSSQKNLNANEPAFASAVTPNVNKKELPSRVDINILMSKARMEEKKSKLENLIYIVLILSFISIVGVLLSL